MADYIEKSCCFHIKWRIIEGDGRVRDTLQGNVDLATRGEQTVIPVEIGIAPNSENSSALSVGSIRPQ